MEGLLQSVGDRNDEDGFHPHCFEEGTICESVINFVHNLTISTIETENAIFFLI